MYLKYKIKSEIVFTLTLNGMKIGILMYLKYKIKSEIVFTLIFNRMKIGKVFKSNTLLLILAQIIFMMQTQLKTPV